MWHSAQRKATKSNCWCYCKACEVYVLLCMIKKKTVLKMRREMISLNIVLILKKKIWNRILVFGDRKGVSAHLWPHLPWSVYLPSQFVPIDDCCFSFTMAVCHYHGVMSSICAVTKQSALVTHSFILIGLISHSLNGRSLVLPLTLTKRSLFECLTPFLISCVCLCLLGSVITAELPDNEQQPQTPRDIAEMSFMITVQCQPCVHNLRTFYRQNIKNKLVFSLTECL